MDLLDKIPDTEEVRARLAAVRAEAIALQKLYKLAKDRDEAVRAKAAADSEREREAAS